MEKSQRAVLPFKILACFTIHPKLKVVLMPMMQVRGMRMDVCDWLMPVQMGVWRSGVGYFLRVRVMMVQIVV